MFIEIFILMIDDFVVMFEVSLVGCDLVEG